MLAGIAAVALLLGFGLYARRLLQAAVYRHEALFCADVERHFLVKSNEARSAGELKQAQDDLKRSKEYGRLKNIFRSAASRPTVPLTFDGASPIP